MTRTEKRLAYAVTAPISAWVLLRGQLAYMREHGFDVRVLSAPGEELSRTAEREGVTAHAVPIVREISILRDILSLARSWWLLLRLRPDIINASTGKAGLVCNLAAVFAGVPCRVHVLRGLRSDTLRGAKRRVLLAAEWLACACAHRVVCISPSLRRKAVRLGLVRERKTVVFGSGSSNGIQVEHFWPSPARLEDAERLRVRLGIPDSAPVIGYVGRFTRDKGIIELTTAFAELRPRFPGVRLLMVGCFEDGDPVPDYVRETIESSAHIIRPGFVADSAPYYQIMDVLAFPTHREGFGNAAVEAAAAGVPVVTTDATGAVDTVVDGVTGFVIPKGDHRALAAALHRLLADPELARRMGKAGQERALREFRPERIWEELHRLYLELLDDPPIRRTGLFIKHSLDLVISTLGLVVLAVPMLMIALTIRLDSPGPVLFKQLRVGYRGAEFWIYKFRSMVAGEHAPGSVASPRDPRVTRLGRLMRHVGLDELPQLLNVLRGEMSLVGPRPLLKTSMRPDKVRRLNMRPGVTGPAVIDAHKRPTREEQDNEDVRYVDRWSLLRDLRILLRTIPALVRPRDHYETE